MPTCAASFPAAGRCKLPSLINGNIANDLLQPIARWGWRSQRAMGPAVPLTLPASVHSIVACIKTFIEQSQLFRSSRSRSRLGRGSVPISQCSTLNRDEESDSLRLGVYGSGNDGLQADSKSLSDVVSTCS